jgi:hypothetical protein
MPEPETNDPNPDVVWRLLSDPRRRYVLEHLHSTERTTLAALARGIEARIEGGEPGDGERTSASRRRIEIALAHDHLPRLADCGVVAYDPSTLEVVLTADAETRRLLEAALESDAAVR